MQLMILDAETKIGKENTMSEINEEILDEKLVKSVTDNFSNDLPVTKSDKLTKINLLGNGKDNEILENNVSNDETNNKPGDNDNTIVIQTYNSNEENEKSSESFGNNSTEKQITVVTENTENKIVVIDAKTDESVKLDLSLILHNENLNNEEMLNFDDQSSTLDDDSIQLNSNLSELSESTKDDSNSNTIKSKDVDYCRHPCPEKNEDKNRYILESERENKLDNDSILNNDEEQGKNCIHIIENNNKDDTKSNNECDVSMGINEETENCSSDKENSLMKDKKDSFTNDKRDSCTNNKDDSVATDKEDRLTEDKEDRLTKDQEGSLKKDEDDILMNEKESFGKDKEPSAYNEDSFTKNEEDSYLKDTEDSLIKVPEDSLIKVTEDSLIKVTEDSLIKVTEDSLIKDREESHTNDKKGSFKEDEKDGPSKNQEDGLSKEDNLTSDIQDSLTENKEDILTKDEENSLTKDIENSSSKNEDNILKSLIDNNYQSNKESSHSEMGEKDALNDKSEDKNESLKRKSFCTENQTVEHKDIVGNEDKDDKNEIWAKESNKSLVSKLSNTLDILTDDEDKEDISMNNENVSNNKGSISLVDDDDIMLIEEHVGEKKELDVHMSEPILKVEDVISIEKQSSTSVDIEDSVMKHEAVCEENSEKNDLDCTQNATSKIAAVKPILPSNFLKTCKKNLADMTREDLEEFCILKIVESVIDRSSLGDVKAQLKSMEHTVEEYKKKFMMVARQSRDLQLVLKSIQEEQKKPSVYPITPLKITRSVGMQVFMTDKLIGKKRKQILTPNNNLPLDKSTRASTNAKTQKNNQQIPVPRLVPAANPTSKPSSTTQAMVNNATKSPQTSNSLVNGIKNSPPAQKPEKRTRMQSVTVDLTDDEPPPKIPTKSSPVPPVRLIPPQNLLAPQRQPFVPNINSPRKVYIPIGSPQTPGMRPAQNMLLKSIPPNPGPRPRGPMNSLAKMQSNSIRMNRVQCTRHPAPLPEALKQYQPSNWKALPPAPDLKLSKVDNGIIISWNIDGYEDDSYEEITSYQLFAYQETSCPPSTALWKKIGDVKALPLPMACTLTQFMAGYKYYFAVRAIDVKSRLGPFSIPGSILLLNKM